MPTRFVSPEPTTTATDKELVAEILREEHIAERHVDALAGLVVAAGGRPLERDPDTGDLRRDVAHAVRYVVAERLRKAVPESTEVALLLGALEIMVGVRQGVNWRPDPETLAPGLAQHLTENHGACDFTAALVVLFGRDVKMAPELRHTGLLAALLREGLVDPTRIVHVDKVRTTWQARHSYSSQREMDPSLLDYWVQIDAERAVAACEELLRREPIETLGAFALGLERTLELRWPGKSEGLYSHLRRLTLLLLSRRRSENAESDRLLTRCCWFFADRVFDATRARLPEEHAAPLTELALAELGRLRTQVRGPHSNATADEDGDYLETAMFFVLRVDNASLWDVLRRLLLAFRELPKRSVPLDLRTWLEPDREPPAWLPEHIGRLLEIFLGRELERDADLKNFRSELAKFCLERLKTRDKPHDPGTPVTNAELIEPNPVWRQGYLHALRELRVNPGGRGHHVVSWSREHDPDDDVRAVAKTTYTVLRRATGIPKDTSPRRVIYAAFWYLRQAHVLAVGETPDEAGAQRTFRKEVRRSKDLDSRS